MINIIVELSKYILIVMIVVYAYLCFGVFAYRSPEAKKRILTQQNVLMFLMHMTAFLVMYLETSDLKMIAFYLMQVVLFSATIILYTNLYPKASRLVVNNLCMLLSVGLIMISPTLKSIHRLFTTKRDALG